MEAFCEAKARKRRRKWTACSHQGDARPHDGAELKEKDEELRQCGEVIMKREEELRIQEEELEKKKKKRFTSFHCMH
jgi:hypothetical protein